MVGRVGSPLKGKFMPCCKLCNQIIRGLKQLLCLLSHAGLSVVVLAGHSHPISMLVWFPSLGLTCAKTFVTVCGGLVSYQELS